MGQARQNRISPDGLTVQERTVLDLWESHLGFIAIAEQTGIPERRVGAIVSMLTGPTEQRDHETAMKSGSARLLAALGTSAT